MFRTEAFFETGTEGVHWCLYDHSRKGYDGLVSIYEGDYLKIYNEDGKSVLWEGTIEFDLDTNRIVYQQYNAYLARPEEWKKKLLEMNGFPELERDGEPLTQHMLNVRDEILNMSEADCRKYLYRYHSQQHAGGWWVHWLQRGVDPAAWAKMFFDELPAELCSKH